MGRDEGSVTSRLMTGVSGSVTLALPRVVFVSKHQGLLIP